MQDNNIQKDFNVSEVEEETRSIVYGNPIRNRYGNFRCYCAAVSN